MAKGIIFEEYIRKVKNFDCCASCHQDEEIGQAIHSIETDWGEGEVCCGAKEAWDEMTLEERDKVRQIMEKMQEEK